MLLKAFARQLSKMFLLGEIPCCSPILSTHLFSSIIFLLQIDSFCFFPDNSPLWHRFALLFLLKLLPFCYSQMMILIVVIIRHFMSSQGYQYADLGRNHF